MKIGEVARKLGISPHTLRYYDKEGLLHFVGRNEAGVRTFTPNDMEWLHCIECLKRCGMPLKDIRKFLDYHYQGDITIAQRLDMLNQLREQVQKQLEMFQFQRDLLDFKISWYTKAAAEGRTDFGLGRLLDMFKEQRARQEHESS